MENTLARSRTTAGGKGWNVEGEHTLEVGMVATREAWADRNLWIDLRAPESPAGTDERHDRVGTGGYRMAWRKLHGLCDGTGRSIRPDTDRSARRQDTDPPRGPQLRISEAPVLPSLLDIATGAGKTAMGTTGSSGDGCLVVHVPSVDWERNGGAYPGRIPCSQDHLQPVTRLDNRHWDVTSPVSWQLSSPTPPLGGSSGFGLRLSGWPSIQDLTARDDTVCVSDIINVALTITYTVLPQGEFHPPN